MKQHVPVDHDKVNGEPASSGDGEVNRHPMQQKIDASPRQPCCKGCEEVIGRCHFYIRTGSRPLDSKADNKRHSSGHPTVGAFLYRSSGPALHRQERTQ
jgi:hypothetical protein